MNGKQTTEVKTDAPETRTRRGAGFLGVDAEGFDHVLLRDERRVVRLNADGIERVSPMDGKDDITYRGWVENQIG